MERELTCIRCPIGCQILVRSEGEELSVTGNMCPRGREYSIKETTHPTRTVTSSVTVDGGELPVVSVKTREDIPKDMIFQVMDEIHQMRISAPVRRGDVIISDAAGTGVNIIATKSVNKAQ